MTTSRFLEYPLGAYASATSITSNRIGEISPDRSAVVGRDGWCFIYEGSNNYINAYHDETLAPLGDDWARLIEHRQTFCSKIGARFVQLIVPNKATLMPENFPEPLGLGITTMMQRLLKASPLANILWPLDELRSPHVKNCCFRRNDSHLTIGGNAVLADLLLGAVEIDPGDIPFISSKRINHIGDLGSKFAAPIDEQFAAPLFTSGLLNEISLEKTDETVAAGFNGTRQSFLNRTAPIRQSIVVFGNSFFEKVPSWGLSPIFTALFEIVHFIWTPNFDKSLLQRIRPDYVIAQTCERFLTTLPND